MIKLYTDISAAFEHVRKRWKPKHLDVLAGYFGVGATGVLKELGFRKIRFVFGLPDSKPSLVKSKITELNLLENIAEIRTSSALHAKVYIMDDIVAIVGSANLTSAAFGSNQEAVILTDQAGVVRKAKEVFSTIWNAAKPLNIRSIKQAAPSKSHAEESGSIGKRSLDPKSLFARTKKTSTAKSGVGRRSLTPQVRICAYPAIRFREGKLFGNRDKIEWSATTTTRKGDIHIFCVTSAPDGPIYDVAHSIWRATSDHIHRRAMEWPERAKFQRVLTLENPVPKSAIREGGLLIKKKRVGWPMNNSGKLLKSEAEAKKLARALSKPNPEQTAEIFAALCDRD